MACLKRWMIVMGVGYLTQGSNIGDSKKFVQLCTVLMDKVEQRHGSKLKPKKAQDYHHFTMVVKLMKPLISEEVNIHAAICHH